MSSKFGHGNKVPGISEVRDVDRGWLLRPGSSQILSANGTWVLRDVTWTLFMAKASLVTGKEGERRGKRKSGMSL